MTRLLVAVAALAVLAACSGSGKDSVDAVPSTGAPATTAAPGSTAPPATPASTTAPARPATVAELLTRRIVLAHAGGDDDYPHSTPYAFAESVKGGVDVLDLDVRLSADGVLVVQHDEVRQLRMNPRCGAQDLG